jgi:hypothetical protein
MQKLLRTCLETDVKDTKDVWLEINAEVTMDISLEINA